MTPNDQPDSMTGDEALTAARHNMPVFKQMLDAQDGCVPCKLCGGKAIITDAGIGAGYYIRCSNHVNFRASRGCMIDGCRLGGWAYNVMDWWNRLHSPTPSSADNALREAVEPWADFHGELPDYDHPLRCVFESGIQYAVGLLAETLCVEDYEVCDGTEEFDGDLGGTLFNIVLAAMPVDEHGDPLHPEQVRAALASSPAAEAEPASVAGEADPLEVGFWKEKAEHAERERDVWKERAMDLRLSKPAPVEAGALRETCEHLESQLDLGHATIFLTPGKARTILAALSKPTPVEAGTLREALAARLCDDFTAREIAGQEYAPSFEESADHVQDYWRALAEVALSQPGSSESGGWLPIETAPKDGTVIGWVPCAKRGDRIELVKLRNGKPFTVGSEFAFDRPPVTHWMPLPSIPSSKER
ncbi:hypothetical protein [Sphingobium baderi]|uniref:DUF551 domain-containing protein n=1 Tax=Sphingobium baderi LL03 TaxID=1114964 RepID=T0I3N6_9SPHN|nr:hypothetical protein [Sphingobium baderi]EQB06245.1 hypothetical protein L485_01080 [Sphingobium baderi LL03]KMS62717.1 hypothetical protein V475_06560 [Sphingobium baderi LL03]